jgi:transposase-like protein
MKRILRRIFTAEFKREAIKLVTEQGLTLAEASKKLDVATVLQSYPTSCENRQSSPY